MRTTNAHMPSLQQPPAIHARHLHENILSGSGLLTPACKELSLSDHGQLQRLEKISEPGAEICTVRIEVHNAASKNKRYSPASTVEPQDLKRCLYDEEAETRQSPLSKRADTAGKVESFDDER